MIRWILRLAICIFMMMVWFHDDGLPETLSEADQAYVLQQSQIAEGRMRDVVDEMRRFVAEPDRESEVADELIDAVYSWVEIGQKQTNDKRFFVKFNDDQYRRQCERLTQLSGELESVTDDMTEEVLARRERGEHDQEVYDRLREAFSDASLSWTDSGDFCDKRKCFWCYCQKQMFR